VAETKPVPTGIVPKLWVHEVHRAFGDRLVGSADNDWFTNQVHMLVLKHFGVPVLEPPLFQDFMGKYESTTDLPSIFDGSNRLAYYNRFNTCCCKTLK
jgi:hypothetical protein